MESRRRNQECCVSQLPCRCSGRHDRVVFSFPPQSPTAQYPRASKFGRLIVFSNRSAPRIFAIIARDQNIGVVIARGPSRWTHILKWDLRTDQFESGAWFAGRIDPTKCDLSPDGTLFLYQAYKHRLVNSTYTDCWTGLSRMPWLAALALWPFGTTYGGGGRFLNNRDIIIRGKAEPHDDHRPEGLHVQYGSCPVHVANNYSTYGLDRWESEDRYGQALIAERGKIFRKRGPSMKVILDLNGSKPNPRRAPDWATRPLISDFERKLFNST